MWLALKTRYKRRLTEMTAQKDITELQFKLIIEESYRTLSYRLMLAQLAKNEEYIQQCL